MTSIRRSKKDIVLENQLKQIHDDKISLIKTKFEQKKNYGNFNRLLLKSIQEADIKNDRQIMQNKREEMLTREQKLAMEMDEMKREEIKKLKLRQQLRINCPELRELERQLKAAYVNKELLVQIAQKQVEKKNEKIETERNHAILQEALMKEEEYKRKTAEQNILKKAEYKKDLQDQLIFKEKSKRQLYEEFLIEKKMIDDVIQRIHDEDIREIEEKMRKMKKTQEEMRKFKEAQDLWKQKRLKEMEEENRRVEEYLQKKGFDIAQRQEKKKQIDEQKEQLQLKLGKQINEERARQKEREAIIEELILEEQRAADRMQHKQAIEKRLKQKLELQQTLNEQIKEREERLRKQAEEDAKFKEELLNKMIEDQKLEQMSQQKQRMKMLQLRKDVEEMMNERRQKKAEEMLLLIKLKEDEDKEMENRRRIIEDERIEMLKEHVNNLAGYLPKGLIKPEELPYLSHK